VTAQPITCDICNAEIAVLLVTNLGNGDTLGVGAACLHTWSQAQADATKPDAAADTPSPPLSEQADGEGEGAAATPRRSRRRETRPTVVPDGPDDLTAELAAADATAD
jgi:hypothetical protein